jgi:lysophospholipase L1-like esterase/ribosomal protein S20
LSSNLTPNSKISSNDIFLGFWDPERTNDSRWYRYQETYQNIYKLWDKHGGLQDALSFLGLKTATPSDDLVRDYLGLGKKEKVTDDHRARAMESYKLDLFDWWWTTPGFSIRYRTSSGVSYLRSGAVIRRGAVYGGTDNLLMVRDHVNTILLGNASGGGVRIKIPRKAGKYPDPDHWWRGADWFTGLRDGKYTSGGKTWAGRFLDLTEADLKSLPKALQAYVSSLKTALNKNDKNTLSLLLEQWLSGERTIFDGLDRSLKLRFSDGNGDRTLFFNRYGVHWNPGEWRDARPWGAWQPENQIPASRDTNTLIVFGDSHSDDYGLGTGAAWPARLQSKMSEAQKRLFRVINYAHSGYRTEQILQEISLCVDDLAKIPGRKTVVIAAGNNDVSKGNGPRFQTNTLANIRQAAHMLAQRGINVLLFRTPGTNWEGLVAIADEIRSQYKSVQISAIHFSSGFTEHRIGKNNSHLNRKGHDLMAQWIMQQQTFVSTLFATPREKVFATNSETWWRTTKFFMDYALGDEGGWRDYWTSDRPDKTNNAAAIAYSKKVKAAFSAFQMSSTQANYNAIAELLEQWMEGQITGLTQSQRVEEYYGSRFVFAADMVRLWNRKEAYDPDGAKYGPLTNPDYKAPAFDPRNFTVDKSVWWRSNAFFVEYALGNEGGWRTYWTRDNFEAKSASKTYSDRVKAAVKTYDANKTKANFIAIIALLEEWFKGKVPGLTGKETVQHWFGGATFVFGANMVRLSNKKDAYDPDGAKYGPLTNPDYKAPAFDPRNFTVDKSVWWRSNAFFVEYALGNEGGWRTYWTRDNFEAKSASKTYSDRVKAAVKTYDANKTKANFIAIIALLEEWFKGKVPGLTGKETVQHWFGGATFVFGANMVRLSNKKDAYDPAGAKYGPLTSPDYKAPAFDPRNFTVDKSVWWRSNAFFVEYALGNEGGWRTYWTRDNFKAKSASKTYSDRVKAAVKTYDANKTKANFIAIIALLEEWFKGKVPGLTGKETVQHWFGGATFVFGANMVRLSNKKDAYDPAGAKYGPLTSPDYKAPAFDPRNFTVDKSVWWRSNAFFVEYALGNEGGWRTYWTRDNFEAKSASKTYSDRVKAAVKTYDANKTKANFIAIIALLEEWFKGKVPGLTGKETVQHWFGGATFVFGANMVRLSNKKDAYDPAGAKYGPLTSPDYKAPAFDPRNFTVDKSVWWRSNAFFVEYALGNEGGWRTYWTRDNFEAKSASKTYSDRVKAAVKTYDANKTKANFIAIIALLEEWFKGKVPGLTGKETVQHWFGGATFVFGANMVRLSNKKDAYDPAGAKYGPLTSPDYKAPAFDPRNFTVDKSVWWRSNAFFVEYALGNEGGWRTYWTRDNFEAKSASKTYSDRVKAAVKTYDANKTKANFIAIIALLEEWFKGKVPGLTGKETVQHWFGGATFVFGANMVRLSDKKDAFDPDGAKYGPLTSPDYKAPDVDPKFWWRSTDWFKNELFNSGWRGFWTDEDRGGKADKKYHAEVSKASAAYDKNKSQQNFNALAALLEKWLDGTINGTKPAHRVEHYNNGSYYIFGPDAVRRSKDNGVKVSNPDYKAPEVDPKFWWRSTDWFKNELFNSGWRGFWTDEDRGGKADRKYHAEVSKASAAYDKNKSKTNFNALAALLEKWLDGTINGTAKAHRVEHYNNGSYYIFGPDAVRRSKDNGVRVSNPNYKSGKREILIIGDSLSDGDWQRSKDAVWSRLLPAKLKEAGYTDYEMNEQATAAIGTRTVGRRQGAKEALQKALKSNPKPAVVVIGIGVNNYPRGISLADTEADINEMVSTARKTGAKVLLLGMYLPPGLRGDKLTDADKKWLKANQINPATRDAWSKGLQKIHDKIANKYLTDGNLIYLRNYWDPIDGDDDWLQDSEMQRDDKIHPALKHQKKLFDHVWSALNPLILSNSQISFPGVSRFTGNAVDAGRDPELRFDLKAALPRDVKLPLKYWVKINDPEAGEKNGDYPNASKYVNFKEVFYRYSATEQWRKVDYATDETTITLKKGVKTVFLKFETYVQAPFSFNLFVNFGGESYSIKVNDRPDSYLYYRDQGDTSDRSVADVRQDVDSNTCYVLAALQAAVSTADGNRSIGLLITTKDDNYLVNFAGTMIAIKKSEVATDTLWDKDAAAAGRSGRELWVRVLELAYLRATKSDLQKDGSPLKPLEMFTGAKATQINGGDRGTDAVKKILKDRGENHIVIGTRQKLDSSLNAYRSNHAYAITGINPDGTFRMWDPIGGKLVNISETDLRKISERYFITNFDKTGIPTEPDINGDGIPDAYARLTFLSEHKIKTPEADNRYYTFIKNDDGKLYSIEKVWAAYRLKYPNGDRNAHLISSNYDNNLFKKYKQVKKAPANDTYGYPEGATYYIVELWQRDIDHYGDDVFTQVYVKAFPAKSQVRLSQSTEYTLGLEFRAFVDLENVTPDEAKRLRAGVVLGATKNYEMMTTWAEKGHMTNGSPWRLRVRFSAAAEGILYASGTGAGVVGGLRWKFQLQFGRIDDGVSWWITLGAEVSNALDLSSTEESFALLANAAVKNDKEAYDKHLAAMLSKLASGNVYFGMNGLIQDGVKVMAEKMAKRVQDRRTQEQENAYVATINFLDADDPDREPVQQQLDQLRQRRSFLEKAFYKYGEYFHNFKWKIELGALWLPFTSGSPLQGDGRYAGAGTSDDPADKAYDEIQKIMTWQKKLKNLIENGTDEQLMKLLPAGAMTIINAIGVSRTFGDAIDTAIVNADRSVANDPDNGRYRALAAELTAPMKSVLMGSIMPIVTERIMQRLLSETKRLEDGKPLSFPIPFQGESADAYGSRLAKFATSLVGDALRSVFTSREAMLNMLLYGATLFTTEAIARFLEELDKRISGDAALTDANERQILRKAKAEDYKRFGISDDVAKDLANGDSIAEVAKKHKLDAGEVATLSKRVDQASLAAAMRGAAIDPNAALKLAKGEAFDKVAGDMGWNDRQRENIRNKLETVAKSYGRGATVIADEAFKTGMNASQKAAYEALKGISGVPRETLRDIIFNPDKYATLTNGLTDDAKEALEARIEAARAKSSNPTINALSERAGSGWLSGLTPDQRDVARALFNELNKTGEADGRAGRQRIAREFAQSGLKQNEVSTTARAVRDFTTSLRTLARLSLPDALLVAVLAIPLFIALAKNDSNALRRAATELATEAVFGGAAVAVAAAFGGPAALAFGVLFIVSDIGGKYYEDQMKKNPWFITTTKGSALAPFFGIKKISDGVTGFFKRLFGRSGGDRSIRFDPMSPKEVAYLAFAGVYKAAIDAGKGSEAASMALTFELIKQGVLSLSGLSKGTSNKGFNLNNAVFDLSEITNQQWSRALAEYVHQRVNLDGKNNEVAEIIAATLNAFNNINKPKGLGSYTGAQVRFWFRGQGMYLNEKIDATIPAFISGRIRQEWQSGFATLLDAGVLGFSDGQLQFQFGNSEDFADHFSNSLHWASGSNDEWIDQHELARAFDMVNAGETHRGGSARYERLRVAMRFFNKYTDAWRRDFLTKEQLSQLIKDRHLRAIQGRTWIGGKEENATIFDLDIDWKGIYRGSWGNRTDVIRDLVIDAAKFGGGGNFRDAHLGDALVRLGLLPMSAWGNDAKDVAKFLIRAVDRNVDLGAIDQNRILSALINQGAIHIPANGQPLTLQLRNLSPQQVAQSIFALSGSKDGVIGVEDLLRAFNYVLPQERAFDKDASGYWLYRGEYQPWFKRTSDARADLNSWLGSLASTGFVEFGGGEWRFKDTEKLRQAIAAGHFNALLDSRYKQAYPESLAPVVLDLTGGGLSFESLATSGALYDSNGDGTKELVSWAGRGTGILSYDINGDGVIERTNEIAFTSYKPGAKTDLEGLSAFDTNKNGLLDAGDTSWKKFGVWIDTDQDGVSDAGEFRSLDDLRIASIGLTSDNVHRRLDGVTVHGLSTFTTTSGKRGTVGDVSFDVSRGALSDAEIARRRDLLVQTIAGAGGSKAASTSLRALGTDASLDLNLFGVKK